MDDDRRDGTGMAAVIMLLAALSGGVISATLTAGIMAWAGCR